jgi:hypothetical protein
VFPLTVLCNSNIVERQSEGLILLTQGDTKTPLEYRYVMSAEDLLVTNSRQTIMSTPTSNNMQLAASLNTLAAEIDLL